MLEGERVCGEMGLFLWASCMTTQGVAIAHTPGASAAQFRVAGYPTLGTVALLLMEVQQIVQRRISHQPASARAASHTCGVG